MAGIVLEITDGTSNYGSSDIHVIHRNYKSAFGAYSECAFLISKIVVYRKLEKY